MVNLNLLFTKLVPLSLCVPIYTGNLVQFFKSFLSLHIHMSIRVYYLYLYICIYALYMPIALGASSSEDYPSISMCKSPEFSVGGRRGEAIAENDDGRSSSSSSSTIGRNSDESAAGGDADGDGVEVQSSAKCGPLDNLEDLEEALPLKRGISKFYVGKSKSFTSLSDASSYSSLKDIVKPENAYTRKRKNLLGFNNFFGINSSYQHSCGEIYKKPTNSRSSLAATMSCSMGNNTKSASFNSRNECSSSPPEQKFSTWQSLSLSDLQGAAAPIPSITTIKELDKIQ